MTASASQRPPKRVLHFAEAGCRFAIVWCRIRNSAVGQQPVFCSEEQQGGGGRNAGQPVAQCAFLEVPPGNSLSRIAGDRWLCRNHSAQPGTLTFRWTHFPSDRCSPQHKKR